MRVLRLRFKNLNSLAGEWEIDFTRPEYVSSGIFAITGPTGAGKTTILDAICLGLYGQTPRLSRISQTENEIMSRQTGECFAEVEFETSRGRFRCHWSQHRSRKQAGGALQAPRHEIVEAASGTVLESKLKAVTAKVEEVTGMDFDRFTRSMLLAQGGFAAFLQARADDRAPILEQITGTEIYSQISIKVHERTVDERKRLAELRVEIEGISFLSLAEEEALRAEILAKQGEEVPLAARLAEIRAAQAWRERILALQTELLQLEQAWLDFAVRKEAAIPDLKRLAGAGRALTLAGEYAHIGALRQQQLREQAELQCLEARLPQLTESCQTATKTLAQAEATLVSAREEQRREMELICKTRALDVKLGEAAVQRKAVTVEIEKQQQLCGEYRLAIANSEARLQETGAKLQAALDFLAAHQVDAGLAEALTGIEQQFKALTTLERQVRETKTKLARQAAVVETAQGKLQQEATAFEGAAQAALRAESHCRALVAGRENLLQGRDLAAWRAEAEGVAARHMRLLALLEVLARVEVTQVKLAEIGDRLKTLAEQRQALTAKEESLAGTVAWQEEVCRQRQEKVVLLNRVRDLEAERAQLVDGLPCPLCGASDHPYAQGNVPALDEAQQELSQGLAELKNGKRQLDVVRTDVVAAGKDLEQAGQASLDLQERLARDNAVCATEVAGLELAAGAESWLGLVRLEAERCQASLASLRGVIAQAEKIELEERRAQAAGNTLKETMAKLDKARLAADLGQGAAQKELERLQAEAATLRQALDQALLEVGQALAPYGEAVVADKVEALLVSDHGGRPHSDALPQNRERLQGAPDARKRPANYTPVCEQAADSVQYPLEGYTADGVSCDRLPLLAGLLVRREAYAQRCQVERALQKRLAEVGGEKEKQQALLTEADKALAERSRQLLEKIGQRDELAAQRQALYGKRNPDHEEKRLAEALRVAGLEREKALQGHNRLQAELAGVNQQLVKLNASVAERQARLAELEPAFGQRLQAAGFSDEAAFRGAALPQADFDRLQKWAEGLRQEETGILTRQQDRRTTLLAEQEKRLTELSHDQMREENVMLSGQLSALQQGLGALQQRLQSHAEQQQRHQARLQGIDRQRQECARWERLHSLIGSSDGKKFRNFAQGLTFELMVAHANRQLQKMSDRYILVRDDNEPLELNVIDNYQAGEIRSTKNLSGGESFIASLALSLGLSSMASRKVRVDSLFLDEGFGTLDEDALETALETLAGLQQDGKLIGIISHVPALKERIGTQIQVEAGSAGRSSLRGPGCRRIV